jgi:hypothetical protein
MFAWSPRSWGSGWERWARGRCISNWESVGQLDQANDIPALTAAMIVEEIFAGIDIERRLNFLVRWAESDELRVVTHRPCNPVLVSVNSRAVASVA